MQLVSAGVLLFTLSPEFLVFIVHPGGPFWKNKDEGAWTLPKGLVEPGEEIAQAARREFAEEVGISLDADQKMIELGSIKLKTGKVVHGFGYEYPQPVPIVTQSNYTQIEWPVKSGNKITIPEVEKGEWFSAEVAKRKLNPAQALFVDRLLALLQV